MPRKPRLQIEGGLFHLTARGNRKEAIFVTRDDYQLFLQLAASVIVGRSWVCLSYCLMPNHYHLVLETPGRDLSAGMQHLNGRYGAWFNHRHGLTGHVFQGRFHSTLIETEAHFLGVVRYAARNPVRAGLCADPAGWEWSSYGASIGRVRPAPYLALDRLLASFAAEPARARSRLRAFVEELDRAPT